MTNTRSTHSFFPVLGNAAEILASIPLPADSLAALRSLSKHASPELARAVLSLRDLRDRAPSKFRDPGAVLLTAKSLEQATDGRVAAWRAARMAELASGMEFWDCTAGLGADSLALIDWNLEVFASDSDPQTAALLGHNLGQERVMVADALANPFAPGKQPGVLLFDPDRRTRDKAGQRGGQGGGRRRLDPGDFGPSLDQWAAVLGRSEGASVKLPPGLEPKQLEDDSDFGPWLAKTPHRWTWVEAGGALRELTLWTGILAPPSAPRRQAVRILGPDFPAAGSESPWAGLSTDQAAKAGTYSAPPPPEAITHMAEARTSARRAGAAGLACAGADPRLLPIDLVGSYFAAIAPGEELRSTDFADVFKVLACEPLDRKHVRRMLRDHGIGPLTIKKRGIDESSDALAAKIGHKAIKSGQPGTLIVSPTSAGHRAFLVKRIR